MTSLMPYVDLCICNEEDAKDVFGIEADGTDIEKGALSREGYVGVAKNSLTNSDLRKWQSLSAKVFQPTTTIGLQCFTLTA